MQNADNAELADHIAGRLGERRPAMLFEVDWTGSGDYVDITSAVDSLDVARSLTGDLPEEAGLIDGYTSSTCDVVLAGGLDVAGEVWPVVTALSPFVPGSLRDGRQLVRARARASLGMVLDGGPVLMRQWSGPIRELDTSAGDGTVKLSGVDPSDRLRAPVTLPTYAEFVTHAHRRPWALTVNSQWVIDHVLRRNGIYASPPARPEAIISCTGHGGLVAEVGFNGAPISIYGDGPTGGLWLEGEHPFKMLSTSEASNGGTVGYQEFYGATDNINPPVKFESGQGVGLSCWLHMGSGMNLGASFENRLFQIRPTVNEQPRLFVNGFGNGDITCGLVDEAGFVVSTPRIPTGSGSWRFFGVHFRWTAAATLVVTVRLDGQTRTYTLNQALVTVTPTALYDGYRPILHVNGQLFRSWTNLQVWPGFAPPAAGAWQGETHTPQADIARGMNELIFLPDVANADSWDLLKAVVSAEFGVHAFDEDGRYSFRQRTDVRPSQVDVEFDVDANLADIAYSTSTDSVRNIVGIETSASYHSGDLQTVASARDAFEFTCPVGTTTFDIDWPHGAAGYQGGTLPYHGPPGGDPGPNGVNWSNDVIHGWTYSSGTNFTTAANNRSVVVRWAQVEARKVRLRVSNPGPGPIRLATAADPADPFGKPGDPALRLGGWPLVQVTDHVEQVRAPESRIAAHLGERALPLEKTEWRQNPAALRPLAVQLLAALASEVAVLEDLDVIGDPRIQVGDVARVKFRDGGTPVVGTIVKTLPAADENGIRGKVSVRPLPEQALAPAGFTFYIDISRYQGERGDPIDLGRVASLGYEGCVIKIGQGAGTFVNSSGVTVNYGETLDPYWETFRNRSRVLWPNTTAGYWYVGNVESPASQAARCKAAIGDVSIPVMLDWESGGGDFNNLLAVLAAFRSAGLRVTMLYLGPGYAAANGAANVDTATGGLNIVCARYWTNNQGEPRALWNDMAPGFGYVPFNGATPDAHQFTQYGVVYPGMVIDVNSHPGTREDLSDMFYGR